VPPVGDRGVVRPMETRNKEDDETSLGGVCGRLRGVGVRRSVTTEGGKEKDGALRGERSPERSPDPSDVERDGAPGAFKLEIDSGWPFQMYAEDDLEGARGKIKPIGRGGIRFAVTRLPMP